MKTSTKIVLLLILAFAIGAGIYLWREAKQVSTDLKNAGNTGQEQAGDSTTTPVSTNTTGLPLKLPAGFSAATFAKVPDARVMAFDSEGNMWVSQSDKGSVVKLVVKDGQVASQQVMFKGLNTPHGIAMSITDKNAVYIAEQTRIVKGDIHKSGQLTKIADLPKGGRHTTRTLGFGPDRRLYVSIGSTCDVCNEKDERLASIYSMKEDGSDFKKVASGLRNSVFFTWSYVDGKMYATDMGRDFLGNNLPPDEINIIENGKDYGWPICYGQNVHDTNFDKNQYIQDPCKGKAAPFVELSAHSAPLGIAMVPEEGWPEQYWYNLLVAEHGSWNSTKPVGYKIVRVKLDSKGSYQGTEDFITGFLPENAKSGNDAVGRPVDILLQPGGVMYVSDDKAGAIYKVTISQDTSASKAPTPANPVVLDTLKENATISSPLTITGKALGRWYFEASFPVQLLDAHGNVVAQAPAQAEGDWMQEGYVPFKATLTFTKPATGEGMLVFKKDNPSGDPARDESFSITVKFANSTSAKPSPTKTVQAVSAGCVVSGCSGEICSNENVNSLCVYKPEFACYKTARCEKQANGQCGWTQDKTLTSCLASAQ